MLFPIYLHLPGSRLGAHVKELRESLTTEPRTAPRLWLLPGWRPSGRREVGYTVRLLVLACFLVPSQVAAETYSVYAVDPLEGATEIEAKVWVGTGLPGYSDDQTGEFLFGEKQKALRETIQTFLHNEISAAGYEISLRKGPRYWVMDAPRELKNSNFAHRTLVVEVNGSRLEHRDLDSALYMILVETLFCVDFWRSDRSTRSSRSLTHLQGLIVQDASPVGHICEDAGGDHVVAPYYRRKMVVANDAEFEQMIMKVVGDQVNGLLSDDGKTRAEFDRDSTDSWEVGGRYTIQVAPRGAGDLYQYLQGTTLIDPLMLTVNETDRSARDEPLLEFSLIDRRRPERILMSPDQRFLVLFFGGWSSPKTTLIALYRRNGEYLGELTRGELVALAGPQWDLSSDCLDNLELRWLEADHSIDPGSEHLVLSLPTCSVGLSGGEATTRKIRVDLMDALWWSPRVVRTQDQPVAQ